MVEIVRDVTVEWNGRRLRTVTRLDPEPPPLTHTSTAHCLAFDGERVALALHRDRDWTIPGGHLELGESAEQAATREAAEEAGAVVEDLIVFAPEQVDPVDGTTSDPGYTVPSFQVFFVGRLVDLGPPTATDECSESRLFDPDEARRTPGWVNRNGPLYEAALLLARSRH
jgi:8-oxo-dGTP pyrophosphatase MutT (NUDIX family)